MLEMKNIIMLGKIVRATLLVCLGIWWGWSLASYPVEPISTVVFLGAFFLIPICACATLLLNYLAKKHQKTKNDQKQ
jgi:hypothetical protein